MDSDVLLRPKSSVLIVKIKEFLAPATSRLLASVSHVDFLRIFSLELLGTNI